MEAGISFRNFGDFRGRVGVVEQNLRIAFPMVRRKLLQLIVLQRLARTG